MLLQAVETVGTDDADSCKVVSVSSPGVLQLWRQGLSSRSGVADLPLTTSFVEPVSSVPSANQVVVLIHQNILDTVFPTAVILTSVDLVEPSQECSELATTFYLLYRSVDNDLAHLNLFVHNTAEIYPNLGLIRHILRYRSRDETRMRRMEAILPPVVCCSRTVVNGVDRENHVAFEDDDDSALGSFCSREPDRHRAWQQVRDNFGFDKSNVSSDL